MAVLMMGFEQHKDPGKGDAPGAFGSARRSAGQERAVELAVTRREASCKQIAPESNVRIEARVSRRALANHDWHWPRCAAEPLPPHMTLWAAMRSIRSAISLPSIDPPQAHENSASSSLESSRNRCAFAAPQAGGVQDVVFRCKCERRTRMREIFPLTGVAVFQGRELRPMVPGSGRLSV